MKRQKAAAMGRRGDAETRRRGDTEARVITVSVATSPARRVSASLLILLFAFCLLPFAFSQSLAPRYESSREKANRSANEAARRGEDLRHQWKLNAAESAFREAIAL